MARRARSRIVVLVFTVVTHELSREVVEQAELGVGKQTPNVVNDVSGRMLVQRVLRGSGVEPDGLYGESHRWCAVSETPFPAQLDGHALISHEAFPLREFARGIGARPELGGYDEEVEQEDLALSRNPVFGLVEKDSEKGTGRGPPELSIHLLVLQMLAHHCP